MGKKDEIPTYDGTQGTLDKNYGTSHGGGKVFSKKTRRRRLGEWTDKFGNVRQEQGSGNSVFQETTAIVEDKHGTKFKKRRIETAPEAAGGGSYDRRKAEQMRKGKFGSAGKGDQERPVNRGKYRKNFNKIKGMTKRKDGVVRSNRFKKAYK